MGIIVKSPREIETMRKAGRIVASILDMLKKRVEPGIITQDLDALAVEELKRYDAVPSFKGYRGYPANLCVSINDELVHGIPGERVVEEGDIVSFDFAAQVSGVHADAACTVGVGAISPLAKDLIETTEGALQAGISQAKDSMRLGDISAAIQNFVEARGFSVVREYVGHGIGREMHESPQIPNYGTPGQGPLLRTGMTLALEPMVNVGGWKTKVGSDGWTVFTADGSLCAHFEDTILITNNEAEILTRLD